MIQVYLEPTGAWKSQMRWLQISEQASHMQTLFLFLAARELCFGRHPCIYASNCFESQLCIANHSTLTNLLAFLYEHTGIYYG